MCCFLDGVDLMFGVCLLGVSVGNLIIGGCQLFFDDVDVVWVVVDEMVDEIRDWYGFGLIVFVTFFDVEIVLEVDGGLGFSGWLIRFE